MKHQSKVTFGSILITLGIVFGDIGTSPLYVFTAITEGKHFNPELILGALSCVLWTLILLATYKYVYLALKADNKGEGGIFALYALLMKTKAKWIIYPALIGCAALISDGFLTPAISISSAIEGLTIPFPELQTLPIVLGIIIVLFLFQQFGTQLIGMTFGPIMLIWFTFLGSIGIYHVMQNPAVLQAINPAYAVNFILFYPKGIWFLGAVFLCCTGAEALYSDLGHFGKKNIRVSWAFVFVMLLLNYSGQAAYCLSLPQGTELQSVFYATIPKSLLPFAIGIATISAIIASQALITGIFTLVNEAMKLRLWANLKVKYPTNNQGQVYIPFINYFLMFGSIAVILIFKRSTNMEAAYGLSIIINMLMTSMLMALLITTQKLKTKTFAYLGLVVFTAFELAFLVSNISKIKHGGWFSLLIAIVLFGLLLLYYQARIIRKKIANYVGFEDVIPVLEDLIKDDSIPFEATNLVYPARASYSKKIDAPITYSLFNMKPKKAKHYWFVHIETTDEPKGIRYFSESLIPNQCFYVKVEFGFKEEHNLEKIMHQIHDDLALNNELDGTSAFNSLQKNNIPPDFKYVILNTRLIDESQLNVFDYLSIKVYRFIKSIGLSTSNDFGLEYTNTVKEYIPISIYKEHNLNIHRDYYDTGL